MRNFVRALISVAVLLACGTACKQNQTNNELVQYAKVEQKPMFNGGAVNGFTTWVSGQIKYPEEAYKNGAQGRVILRFVISKKGDVKDVKVVKSSGIELLDNEALRVVSMSPDWTPGKVNGKPVDVMFTFPVVFKLEGETKEVADTSGTIMFATVEQKPAFMGNNPPGESFSNWVYGQMKYPEEAIKNQMQGRVIIQFTIAKDGNVKDVTVAKSSGSKIIDDEAVRVVSMSPQWEPGKQNGEPVDIRFTFPLVFQLK
ncbi:MAG: energy transducer TonB [Bacteroidales bacterium]|nr:energy transducer TonB [Bacteroidales bacterium]